MSTTYGFDSKNVSEPVAINRMWGNVPSQPVARAPNQEFMKSPVDMVLDKLARLSVNSLRYQTCYQEAINEGIDLEGRVPLPTYLTDDTDYRSSVPATNARPRVPDQRPPARFGGTCHYCGIVGHRSRDCTTVEEDIRKGWIIILSGKATYPDGRAITGPFGARKSAIVADYYRNKASAPPQVVNTHCYEIDLDEGMFDVDDGLFEVDEDDLDDQHDPASSERDQVHRVNLIHGEYQDERDDRVHVEEMSSHGVNLHEKGRPGRPTGITNGPKGKPSAYTDKTAPFSEKRPSPASGSNATPTGPRNAASPAPPKTAAKPSIAKNPLRAKILEDQRYDKTIPPEDVEMKEVIKNKGRKESSERPVRQSDFAREVDVQKIAGALLDTKIPLTLSIKELLAVSPLMTSMVNKGTRVHAQLMEGVKRTVSFAEAGGEVVEEITPSCEGCSGGCADCLNVTSYNIGAQYEMEDEEQLDAAANVESDAADGTQSEVEVLRAIVDRMQNGGIRMPSVMPTAANERVCYHHKLIKFNGTLNDNRVVFMIDTGSEIDVCPTHIYNKMQSPPPCRTDMNIYLKGMNGPGKRMRGVMENCEIKVGNMRVQSNLHLHDEGPNCIILGQPFLHRARFEHFWDGERPNVRFTTEDGTVEFPYTQTGKTEAGETDEQVREVIEGSDARLTSTGRPRQHPF